METEISNFEPLLNQMFLAKPEGGEIPLHLVEVASKGEPYKDGARQPFSLVFTSEISNGLMHQGIYPVENDTLGLQDIFLIPFSDEGGKFHYQAIYN